MCERCENGVIYFDDGSSAARYYLCDCLDCQCEHGLVNLTFTGSNGVEYEGVGPCPNCDDARTRARVWTAAEIPVRYAGSTLRTVFANQQSARDALVEWAGCVYAEDSTRRGFALAGPVGVGKTALAVAAIKTLALERSRMVVRVWRYLRQLQARFDGTTEALERWHRRVAGVDVLLLDDLSAFRGSSEWQQQELAELISTRYDGALVTCVTANVPLEPDIARLLGCWGESVVSRIREMTTPIVVTGPDRRHTRGS